MPCSSALREQRYLCSHERAIAPLQEQLTGARGGPRPQGADYLGERSNHWDTVHKFTVTLVMVISGVARLSTVTFMCPLVLSQCLHAKSIQEFGALWNPLSAPHYICMRLPHASSILPIFVNQSVLKSTWQKNLISASFGAGCLVLLIKSVFHKRGLQKVAGHAGHHHGVATALEKGPCKSFQSLYETVGGSTE